jgi:hypothetical protein
MADKDAREAADASMRLVNRDLVQIEFVIDDLMKQLVQDHLSPVASCNGCHGCKAAVDLPEVEGRA